MKPIWKKWFHILVKNNTFHFFFNFKISIAYGPYYGCHGIYLLSYLQENIIFSIYKKRGIHLLNSKKLYVDTVFRRYCSYFHKNSWKVSKFCGDRPFWPTNQFEKTGIFGYFLEKSSKINYKMLVIVSHIIWVII